MTPNYFRIAQENYRAPKASRSNWYVDWVLAYRPGRNTPPKNNAGGALFHHSNQAKA
jgi:hypothetical protein